MNYMYEIERNWKAFADLNSFHLETVGEMTIYLLFCLIIKMIYAIKEEIFVNGLVVWVYETCMEEIFITFVSFVRFIQTNRNVHSSSVNKSPGVLATALNTV